MHPNPTPVTRRPTGALRFAVLGPVRVWRGEEPLPTGSPQQRALLATLLLRGGRTATAPELVDALWGDEPPDAALAALRTYASRLRKVLGPDADALVSESGGYALRIGEARFDVDVATRHEAEAQEALAGGRRAQALAHVDRALGVFDGEPLAGLPGPYADSQRVRLEEWRLSLIETRIGLHLDLGRHAEAVSELTAQTAAHPLRERLRELLMLALYRSGRQAEALAVYADTRRLLADELGVDPAPELSELQQRILAADPELMGANPSTERTYTGPRVPTQLPADVPDFTGRSELVGPVVEHLAGAAANVMTTVTVSGLGGVGKTTLAVHVAHVARRHFPDGQLYVDLHDAGPVSAEPEAVLGSFLRALGTPDSGIPDGVQERAALFRSTLEGRRVLVLLDNARDAAQVRPLLPGTEGSATIVTSRARVAGIVGSLAVDLEVLEPDEAVRLFTRIVGEQRVDAERGAVLDVVAACGFLPLAIRIAGSRLAARRTWTVSTLARKLADERRRLDELRSGDLALRTTFDLGYGHLDPESARAFCLLGLSDGRDIRLEAAAAMLDRGLGEVEEVLERLVDTSLLESTTPGRYRYHDLLRSYARERPDYEAEREAALLRLYRFHLASARTAYAATHPGDRSVEHLWGTEGEGTVFAGHRDALDWLFDEAGNLLPVVEQATAQSSGEVLRCAVDTLWAARDLVESGAWARSWIRAADALATAAQERGEPVVEGRARCLLGQAFVVEGRFEEAGAEAMRAETLSRTTGDRLVHLQALTLRGNAAHIRRAHEEAERCFQEALEALRAESDCDRHSEATVLASLARVHNETGADEKAVDEARRSVRILRELGAVSRLGNGLYVLGLVLGHAEREDEGFEALGEALALFGEGRQSFWEGMTLFRMAENRLLRGSAAQAAHHAERALAALGDAGGDWRRGTVLTLLGRALRDLGHVERAHACWEEALSLFDSSGAGEAATVRALLGAETAETAGTGGTAGTAGRSPRVLRRSG
ncbi:AfsR/SARP family transcriptional regulator [Streptomyces rectiverticillatus]|uniref:AfsR/SARP family transcriptional regulator n=1 Tax=Streptomyces rectiverticillatus TaxID=173860 RepID=UPI001FEAFC36|nr:BTAD domain-containing putative transcriptional regulator [Streptomyces rectiverticillatus]